MKTIEKLVLALGVASLFLCVSNLALFIGRHSFKNFLAFVVFFLAYNACFE